MLQFINLVFVFAIVFAALFLIKEAFQFIQALVTDDDVSRYEYKESMTTKRLILIACAVSYIISIAIIGLF